MRHQLEAVLKIPHVVREKKELDIVPVCLVTLLILGIVISYVLFFPLEKKRQERCQNPVLGKQRFMALSVFWVSSCPYKASEGSKGPTKLLTAGGAGEEEGGNVFSSVLGCVQEKRFGASFPSLLNFPLHSVLGPLAPTILSLVTHSIQTSPWKLWMEWIPEPHSTLFPVVKHLVFVSCFF